jgi:pimeloyl-ACP methyl ester carboxylesterase
LFPKDLVLPAPRRWLELVFNVKQYRAAPNGGHFAALENPALMIKDIREFFASLR